MKNIIHEKTFNFAVKIINTYKDLCKNKRDYVLSKQLLRCGTSIGANVMESAYGQSKKDFVSKLAIALKETSEAEYWIKLMIATKYISDITGKELLNDLTEINKILSSIIKTSKENLIKN